MYHFKALFFIYACHPAALAYLDAAATTCGQLDKAYLRTDLRAYLLGVADDTHLTTLRIFQIGQGRHHQFERGLVKVAKSLVDEEAADGKIVAL